MPPPKANLGYAFHPAVEGWFARSFAAPTKAQSGAWPPIQRGESTLVLSPTGSGKTLAAFLACIDRLAFSPEPPARERLKVVYVSPLKALAVDVERNLRAPLQGIAELARERGDPHRLLGVAVRSGDTPPAERARFARDPADILITTPESLYLLLTSNARDRLRTVETVIVDEIHALVRTKRGAHLALSLERLEVLAGRPLQRIGLSATQRPLDEVARFLGGTEGEEGGGFRFRPVTVVDAGKGKALELTVEVPVEDMARLGDPVEPKGTSAASPSHGSIWTAIHPRLLELVRAHRSTLLFVNSRRVAERLAAALNELAGETLVHAHHGSLARPQRVAIEAALKAGAVRGLVATSSLELGIDMGAIDLVVQIEAAPSVASALQRIGRAGHQIDAPSRGVFFPKYRADLLACAAQIEAMKEGEVEETRFPRNPLDVLAQQIVGLAALDEWPVDELYRTVRRAAPFATLPRPAFEGVLDLLSGRYPSDELSDLTPRLVFDRVRARVRAREGAKRVAVVNAGTIPDRGLYGVFLLGGAPGQARVGELDEEMVFESKVGETFFLGASTWRIEEITFDRVLVSPAPGEPGKMPFWKGDAPGRPLELGRRIGRLARELAEARREEAHSRLVLRHGLDECAAQNLLRFLDDQRAATGEIPDDRTVVVERYRDELGDWRVCVLSPLGAPLLSPWCLAAAARARERLGVEPETIWTNDGFAVRIPDAGGPPDVSFLFPEPEEVEAEVTAQLGNTPLFAGKFREAAGRALLLPRRRPGGRTPLWQRRKRARDLLAVASRYPEFPILLESYRECLRDVFDLPALVDLLYAIRRGEVRTVTVDTRVPSPFAASLLFGFVASFLYDGDAPLAERRAQALAIDQVQLRELVGEAELRDLLDPAALEELEGRLQQLSAEARARSADGVADLLLRLGDLSSEEVKARSATPEVASALERLLSEGRVVPVLVAGEERFVAVEDAARYRDALGAELPPGVPEVLLGKVDEPLEGLLARFARRRGPFTTGDVVARFGIGPEVALSALETLLARGRLLEGAFRPGGREREFCDPEVLRTLRRRSLARLREEVEPAEPAALCRALLAWHGIPRRRGGTEALLEAVERLQGAPIPASALESEILPARVAGYLPGDLDALAAGGEVLWVGVEALGARDGRVALFRADAFPRLWASRPAEGPQTDRERRIVEHLLLRGASFFPEIHAAAGGGFPPETVDALWALVWRGLLTNDTFQVLRAFTRAPGRRERMRGTIRPSFPGPGRARLAAPQSAGGRWALLEGRALGGGPGTATALSAALAQQLLQRHGVLTRGAVAAEGVAGGFGAVYEVLRHLEEAGRIRRGYFVLGVGAMQFALKEAVDALRAAREAPDRPVVTVLAATDPANPYGAALDWPLPPEEALARRPVRAAGARVVLVDGAPALFLPPARGLTQLVAFLPATEPERSRVGLAAAQAVLDLAREAAERFEGVRVEEINGSPAAGHPFSAYLSRAGFFPSGPGLLLPRRAVPPALAVDADR
ncbi:MAG TPA: DEAD/DEAH box helicase [Anaeromyxobacter sp.]|nr:DEAD/DEAH box helicase [Anaeromyxobacter sp.]